MLLCFDVRRLKEKPATPEIFRKVKWLGLSRLSGIRAQLDHAVTDPKGELHSMPDDLKQALIRGRALERGGG